MSDAARKSRTGISNPRTPTRASGAGTSLSRLADVVRLQRVQAGLTQKNLAALANTGVRFIVELEQGKPTLEIGKVLLVLQTLGFELTLEPIRTLGPIERTTE